MNLDFNNVPPANVLKQDFMIKYEQVIETIWWQLVNFSSNMIILEKLVNFRFDLFDSDYPYCHFWNRVISSLYESSILCVWRVSIDENYDEGLTINQLKNEIIKNLLNNDISEKFKARLKKINFTESVSHTNEKIIQIRHNAIAHLNLNKDVTSSTQDELPKLNFEELKTVRSKIEEYFYFLCFGAKKLVYPIAYYPDKILPEGSDKRIDVDKILDNIAKENYYVNDDESIPKVWEMQINKLSNEDLAEINKYREKFGKNKIE